MIVSTRNKRFERKFQFGRGNIWTTASSILSKLLGNATAKAMKETFKSVAKKTAQDREASTPPSRKQGGTNCKR